MRRDLTRADTTFVAEVAEFLQQSWAPINAHGTGRQADAVRSLWWAELQRRGWYAPHWPAGVGGQGWSVWRTYLWQRELQRAGAPLPCALHTQALGRLLLSCTDAPGQAGPEQRSATLQRVSEWLLSIANDGESWRVAWSAAAPDWRALFQGLQVTAGAAEGGLWHVRGRLPLAPGPKGARWLLSLLPAAHGGREPHWIVVVFDLQELAAGQKKQAQRSQLGPGHVELSAASLAPAHRLTEPMPAAEVDKVMQPILHALYPPVTEAGGSAPASFSNSAPSVASGRRLEQIVAAVGVNADAYDPAKLSALRVELAGLEVLEARAAAAQQDSGSALPEAGLVTLTLAAAVARRGEALALAVAELELGALGYYALPAPDPQLLDNEGPIEPGALSGLTQAP